MNSWLIYLYSQIFIFSLLLMKFMQIQNFFLSGGVEHWCSKQRWITLNKIWQMKTKSYLLLFRIKILFKRCSIEKRKDCHIYCAEMNEILNKGLKYESMWIHVVNEKTMWTKIHCIIVLTCPLNLKSTWSNWSTYSGII